MIAVVPSGVFRAVETPYTSSSASRHVDSGGRFPLTSMCATCVQRKASRHICKQSFCSTSKHLRVLQMPIHTPANQSLKTCPEQRAWSAGISTNGYIWAKLPTLCLVARASKLPDVSWYSKTMAGFSPTFHVILTRFTSCRTWRTYVTVFHYVLFHLY